MEFDYSPSPKNWNFVSLIDKSILLLTDLSGEFFEKEIDVLNSLKQRFEEGRFNLAVLGQFKRGKSTLLNALLGIDILPTSVIPLTAIPTIIKKDDRFSIRVLFENNDDSEKIYFPNSIEQFKDILFNFVTEEGNPENKKNVREVIVGIPGNRLLDNRVVLIDTPGIGSTYAHNTQVTLNFLPQCDAALFVVSADPPITQVEMEFLQEVYTKIPRLFFVLNKIDYLDCDELKDALYFFGKHIKEVGIPEYTKIFPVSARIGLKSKKQKNKELYKQSGIEEIEKHLIEFLVKEKNKVLSEAVALNTKNSLNNILLNIDILLTSYLMPLNKLERKIEMFKEKIKEIEREKLLIIDVLNGDYKRVHGLLEEFSSNLFETSFSYFSEMLEQYMIMSGEKKQLQEKEIIDRLANDIPAFFEKKMGEATDYFNEKISSILKEHQKKLLLLIISIKRIASELFNVPLRDSVENFYFEIVSEPYWVSHKWDTTFSPITPAIVDKVVPVFMKNRRIYKRLKKRIRTLTVANVENLRWSIYQSIDESFRHFKGLLEERFNDTLMATYWAVEKAMENKKTLGEKVDKELKKIKQIKRDVTLILKEIDSFLQSLRNLKINKKGNP